MVGFKRQPKEAKENVEFADSSVPYDKEAAEVRRLADRNEYAVQLESMSPEEYAAFEKKLLRKMDMRLVPWMT